MNAQDVITAIKGPTGDIGASFYFHADTLARGTELGLDGFRFYALGRGGVLGDVEPGVVQSSFGYFNPELITKLWTSGREILAPREAAREYIACCHRFGRTTFGELTGLDAYVEAAGAVIEAAEGASLALFAGVRAEPVPDDVAAAAAHQAMVLREFRGSAHLAAIASVGLPTPVAHALKRPDDVAMFGWDSAPEITADERARAERVEAITDDVVLPAFSVLTDDQSAALLEGTAAMHAALSAGQ